MQYKSPHHIGGTWISGKGPALLSFNPTTGQLLWEGKEALPEEIATAIYAAKAAFPIWSELPLEGRLNYLLAFKERLNRRLGMLAESISQEVGKPLWESKLEINAAASKLEATLEGYLKRCTFTDEEKVGAMLQVRHLPYGVMGVISPFNFPLLLSHGHIIPALLAGNTIVFKPSQMTPMVAQMVLECWEQTGLPPGVINLIQGGPQTGQNLAFHPGLDGLLFTGSWDTGKALSKQYALWPHKPLVLEMGGNSPIIAWDVDDFTATSSCIILSAFLTSGQRCTSAKRLIIQDNREGDQLLQALLALTKTLRVGGYFEYPEPFMGSVISPQVALNLLGKQHVLETRGASSLLAMHLKQPQTGLLTPGIIDVTAVRGRGDEEIFGPLLQVIKVGSFEEAIREANNTSYGMSASLLCNNPIYYNQFAKQVKAGILNWNQPTTRVSHQAPFGGVKLSGNHRPSGLYAADYCSYPTASLINPELHLPDHPIPGMDLPYQQQKQVWNP